MSGSNDTARSSVLLGFRAAVVGQTLAVAGQSLLAGLALSGSAVALNAHMVLGGFALLTSLLQLGLALPLRHALPRWIVPASVGLLVGEGIQMASGKLHLFALHLPLGLALFAGLTAFSLWALNAVRVCDCPPNQSSAYPWSARSIGGET